MLYIITELTELHELTLIQSFLFLLVVKVHMGKPFPIDLSPPRMQTQVQYCSQLYEILCKVKIFNSHRSRL